LPLSIAELTANGIALTRDEYLFGRTRGADGEPAKGVSKNILLGNFGSDGLEFLTL
jgi:hypothetical protein